MRGACKMLSRTANGLFWMSRYIERAGNIARLLDAGRRMDSIPNSDQGRASEWESIVIASGCRETFPHDLQSATMEQVAEHLIFDPENPSSIHCCLKAARENARAMRIAITREVWDVLNGAWSEMKRKDMRMVTGGKLAAFLEWVKEQGFLFTGAVEASMLRDCGYSFIQLGQNIERADATARLVDVKFHVLLPSAQDVGGGLDHMQWVQLLRAANSLRAFRWTYRETVTPQAVVHFLVLNAASPRSLMCCYQQIVASLHDIGGQTALQDDARRQAEHLGTQLENATVETIIAHGLHEWLTMMIEQTNALGMQIGDAYGFNGPEPMMQEMQAQ